jgi:hypothetical protein
LDRRQSPLFRAGVRGVYKGFGEIEFAAVAQIRGKSLEQAIESSTPLPLLEAAVAGLVGRIAGRQIRPRRAGAQDPQHAVEYATGIRPRPPATIRPPSRPEGRFEHGPLHVG